MLKILLSFIFALLTFFYQPAIAHDYFQIHVVDEETGRGIPMVSLTTNNHIRYVTDSNGLIAFYEPGLMGQSIFVNINGQGYEYPPELLGYHGLAITPLAGDSLVIKMKRKIIAKRLYRITGAGVYRDSEILGKPQPLKRPLLNGKVMGQDSNLSLVHNGKIFWFWGDTFKPEYPIGNFSVSGAVSDLPVNGGLPPEIGVDLDYFVDDTGFSKKMIELPGTGFVWLSWVARVKDNAGNTVIATDYARVKPNFDNMERGIAIFDESTEKFEKYREVPEWLKEYHLTNHPFIGNSNGKSQLYLTSEFAFRRVAPHVDSVATAAAHESFTCLKPGSVFDPDNPALDRAADGTLRWGWKRNTDMVDLKRQQTLIESGHIAAAEGWLHLQDFASGAAVVVNRGSLYWNEYRQRWILIGGAGVGEIWYAEGDSPVGPWRFVRKVTDHDIHFYNPVHHPFLDQENGRTIYFEGTYTKAFLQTQDNLPRYEYNQLMYQLSLDDPRLYMPSPVYKVKNDRGNDYRMKNQLDAEGRWGAVESSPFLAFAPDRQPEGTIAIYQSGEALSTETNGDPLFYALPAEPQKYEQLLGNWECKFTDQVFFTRNIRFQIKRAGESIEVAMESLGYSASEVIATDDSLHMTVGFFNEEHRLAIQVKNGKLSGKWQRKDAEGVGIVDGKSTDYRRYPLQNATLVPLFQYNSRDGKTVVYAIEDAMKNTKLVRAEKPLCRVWRNPAKYLIVDPLVRQGEL